MYYADRGRRPQFRVYGGDRRLEIVSGKVYSAKHPTLGARCSSRHHRRWRSPPPSASSLPPTTTRRARAESGWFGWECGLGGPEMRRRKRVAAYKAYAMEGKLKASLRKGARWIKIKCSQIIRGF